MSDSWYISTHVILLLQRKLTVLNEHIEQPRAHSMVLCTLSILFLNFQNSPPIDTLIVLENIKLWFIQCSSKEKYIWNKKQTNIREIALSNEKNKGCLFISLSYSRGDKWFVSVPREGSWYELWNVKYN